MRRQRSVLEGSDAGGTLEQGRSLIDVLLEEQGRASTAVDQFVLWKEASSSRGETYHRLLPQERPRPGEQYAFRVNLDQCSGCKACVAACHSLNGLDEGETWRDVGELVSEEQPYRQTIPTACHHCLDPACLNGCPVEAYEKDSRTGIVRHLDDQCMGCSYCQLMCPYDVPKYNQRLGIVRKCDMCSPRLAEGEAPACVQACPHEAISIILVSSEEVRAAADSPLLPGVVDSKVTYPGTQFVSARAIPADCGNNESVRLRAEPDHFPLVLMLVLTQWGAGIFSLAGSQREMAIGASLVMCGLVSSAAHLGRPLKACRAFLGWRHSWLSREILVFGFWPLAALMALLGLIPAGWIMPITAAAIFCSMMVYAAAKRPFWNAGDTALKFFGTALILGGATLALMRGTNMGPWALLGLSKLILESVSLHRCAALAPVRKLLATRELWVHRLRIVAALAAVPLSLSNPLLTLLLLVASELGERVTFFRAAVAWRMPISR